MHGKRITLFVMQCTKKCRLDVNEVILDFCKLAKIRQMIPFILPLPLQHLPVVSVIILGLLLIVTGVVLFVSIFSISHLLESLMM